MKILVISDTHDNIVRLRHVLGFGKNDNFAAIIHCGDWNTPLAVSEIFKAGLPVFGVLGNADVDPGVEKMLTLSAAGFDPDFLKVDLPAGRQELIKKIGICHYPFDLNEALMSQKYDLLLCGHTHQRKDQKYRKTRLVNAGALQRTDRPCFVVYDTQKDSVEFVDVAV